MANKNFQSVPYAQVTFSAKVNASSAYLSSHTATLPHKHSPRKVAKFSHNPVETYPLFSDNDWHSPQKNKYTRSHLLNIS